LTRIELIDACLTFEPNFAKIWSKEVISTQSVPTLWELIVESDTLDLSKDDLEKFKFRSAYLLESVFCTDPKPFYPFLNQFFEVFPTVTNPSMRRHFAKICFFALKQGYRPNNIESIATACADWIIDIKTRVAVKVWALDILIELAKINNWIKELLPEVIASLSVNPSAGMMVRLRKIK